MKLCVATHNICHMGKDPIDRTELFPDDTYRNGYEAHTVAIMKERWKSVLSGFSADLIGLQEYYEWFDLAHTIRTEQEVYEPFGYTVTDGGHGLALASKHPAVHMTEASFEPVSTRRWQKFTVTVGGKTIAVFNMHPMPGGPKRPNSKEIRQQEYAMMIETARKEDSFIIFGDYNGRTAEEYRIFSDAGLQMANTGLVTVENDLMCDNIVVSNDIRITGVKVLDPTFSLSDHAVLYAELEVN